MVAITSPMIGVVYDTVMINGEPKNRIRFSGSAMTVTVNNNAPGFSDFNDPDPSVLFDELAPCVFEVEAVDDDDDGGDRWRMTIISGSPFFNDFAFKNFTGDDITAGTTTGLIAGNITITP